MSASAVARRLRAWQVFLVLALLLTLAGGMFLGAQWLELPPTVNEMGVDNPTRYDITIEISNRDRTGWLGLGTARRETTSTFHDIVDQGEVWVFRLRAQGEEGGELQLTRQELERADWNVMIPESVGDTLRAQGAPAPP